MAKLRIAVDFRFIIGGPNVVNRGTGRYTQHQICEILKLDQENHYLLICHQNADVNLLLPEIKNAPNIEILRIPIPNIQTQDQPNHDGRALKNIELFQSWLSTQNLDLFHECTPYQIDELVLYQFDVCPIVTTMYDVIPLVFTDLYWPPGSLYHEELQRAVHFVSQSDRLIAISESARIDAMLYLGVSRSKIDLAYPYADTMFRVLPKAIVSEVMRPLRDRLRIPQTFILSLIHIHHSKNPQVLLAAYGLLPKDVRMAIPLVIVFFLRDVDRTLMESWMQQYGVQDNVILTGLVSDDELVALYNSATIVVHPSRYEGFGLPVVEAMASGAPVITTTAASLPEVGGNAAILVDPDDIQGFTDAMLQLLNDPKQRADMTQKGLKHVLMFNPEQLGHNTLASYYKTLEDAFASKTPKKPRLAVWSTMPPLNCGIADYTVDILPELSTFYDISVYVGDDYLPTQELLFRYKIYHHSAFGRHQQRQPFDMIIYQLGASTMHDYMYDYIIKYPGIVVIHDVNFSYGFHYVYSVRGRIGQFKHDILRIEGRNALRDFEAVESLLIANRGKAPDEFYEKHLLLKWIIISSVAQIVHMPYAKELLESTYPEANVQLVDMGVVNPWLGMPPLQASLSKIELGFSQDSFVIGVFGSVVEIKRIDKILLAFQHVYNVNHEAILVIVGNDTAEPKYTERLQRLIIDLGISDSVFIVGRSDRQLFDEYMRAVDVIVNLRFPSRQQMSATLIRGIACGKPVVVSDLPEWSYLSDEFCWKVAPDHNEINILRDYLLRLHQDKDLRKSMSTAAYNFFTSRANTLHSASQYAEIINAHLANSVK